ncbi:MAG TPA: hypothetical protein VJM49_20440, partial [Acidimicrobiales bacterium]|nr:hypothetical protein [Acidimicrobiales bacterium]
MLGNSDAPSGDWVPVRGSDIREAVSARLDGEDAGLPRPTYVHLATCGDCRTWVAGAEALGRAARRAPSDHPAL